MSNNDFLLSDEYVANLLASDAKQSTIKYSAMGLEAFAPSKPPTNKPKPNTRFLRNIIKETDSHNAALLAKEASDSRARLRELSRNGNHDATEKRKSISGGDIRRRQLGDIAAILGGGPKKKRKLEEDGDRKVEKSMRGESNGGERERKGLREEKRRRRDEEEGDKDRESERRSHHHRSRRDRSVSSEEEDRRREKSHRRRDRERERSRSRSRSPRKDRERKSHHRDRSPITRRRRSNSPTSTDKPKDKDKDRPHRFHRLYSDLEPPSSRKDHKSSKPPTHSPPTTSKSQRRQQEDSDSDPLDDIIGPAPPPPPPQIRSRGRGAISSSSGIDAHFSASYDPSNDISLNPDDVTAEGNDWDQALEALRDRQKWKQQGAERLRAAGFTDEEVKKWEKGGKEKSEEDVRWVGKGEKREWDRGKVVDDEGVVGFDPGFGRLINDDDD